MTKKEDYIQQLSELYETYTGKELERFLDVTVRSIQNYLREDVPTKPSTQVIRKIREAYAKHQNEGNIDVAKPSNGNGDEDTYKDKYIKLLEQRLEEQNRRLQAMEDKIMSYVSSDMVVTYLHSLLSLANTQLDELLDHRAALEKKDVKTLKKAADKRYDAYQAQFVGSGK